MSMKKAIERITDIANLTEMKCKNEESSNDNWYAGKLNAFNTALAILEEEGEQ